MMRSSRWRVGIAGAVAAVGLAATPALHSAAASPAPGSFVLRPHGYYQQRGEQPVTGPLVWSGGPTMRAGSTNYLIFWQPSTSYMNPTYQGLLTRYFNDVGGSAFYGLLTQYYDWGGLIQNSSTLGGTWTDTSPYPSRVLTDANIEAEIGKAMAANGWTGGLNHEFFVYYGRGELMYSAHVGGLSFFGASGFCAFHWFTRINGQYVLYANMPYVGTDLSACGDQSATGQLYPGPNGDADADSEISVTSHEQFETITDPIDNITAYTGWRDLQGYEIGDKCAYYYGPLGADGGNVTVGADRYLVQQEWSNAAHYCALH